jgi:hypothetical protein
MKNRIYKFVNLTTLDVTPPHPPCNSRGGWCRKAAFLLASIFLTFILLFFGCDETPSEIDNYEYEPVLSAFLSAGKTITQADTVAFLERVQPLFDVYDFQKAAISSADMIIIDIEAGDTIRLEDHSISPGKYTPVSGAGMLIQGKHHYKIVVVTPAPHNETVWAETVMPDPFLPGDVKAYLLDQDGNKTPISDGEILSRHKDKYMFFEWPSMDSAGGYVGSGTNLEPINNLVSLDPGWEPEPEPWELVDSLDGDSLGIDAIQAVAYIDRYFYIAGKQNGVNKVFKVDRGGNTIASFNQFGNSGDGMQDLAWDGEMIWGAGDSTVYRFTTDGALRLYFIVDMDSITGIVYNQKDDWICLFSKSDDFAYYARNGYFFHMYDHIISVSGVTYWHNDFDEMYFYFIHNSDDNKPFLYKETFPFTDTMMVQDLSLLGEDWENKRISSAFLTDDMDLKYRYFLTVSKADNRIYILRPGANEEFFTDAGRAGWIVMRADQNSVSLPWALFGFAGQYSLNLNAIAPAYYDYLFSSMRVQQGMLQRPLTNIHNGLGIFGGMAESTINITLVSVTDSSMAK